MILFGLINVACPVEATAFERRVRGIMTKDFFIFGAVFTQPGTFTESVSLNVGVSAYRGPFFFGSSAFFVLFRDDIHKALNPIGILLSYIRRISFPRASSSMRSSFQSSIPVSRTNSKLPTTRRHVRLTK